MSDRLLLGVFKDETDILNATRASRDRGYEIVDVHAPYAVHGLERAMGLGPSRLTWVCFLFGLIGAVFILWVQYWTSAVDWPINVGGKPLNSLPAFVPVTFEVMVLFAGVGTVFALLVRCRLHPWKEPNLPVEGVTNDRFVIVLRERDAGFDTEEASELFRTHNAIDVQERTVGEQGEVG